MNTTQIHKFACKVLDRKNYSITASLKMNVFICCGIVASFDAFRNISAIALVQFIAYETEGQARQEILK